MTDFKWRHFQGDVILWAVRWYCRYPISYRDLEEMLAERGISVDHTTIYRWVQCYAPEMEKRLRWFWRRGFDPSWRLDETYVKVRGKWTYLYRAVDKRGDTIDFYLSPTRSAKAAKRFLGKALRGLKHWEKPATLNTDKAPSYGAAITELKREGKLDRETAHRQVKYLNNVIEADHGKLKILIKPVRGFKSIPTAYATIKGFEVMRALRKGQARPWCLQPGIRGEVRLVERAFGIVGADGGHGHAQPPFRSSRLIGAERQPTSDCRQSLQQSPAWVRTWVDGELRRRPIADLVFPPAALVSFISQFVQLNPGDVISTGTPAGVGHGMKPQRYLGDGQEMEIAIEGLGRQRNSLRITGE